VALPTRGWVCGVDIVLVVTLTNTPAVISLVVFARQAERQTVPSTVRTQLVALQAALYIHTRGHFEGGTGGNAVPILKASKNAQERNAAVKIKTKKLFAQS